MKGARQVDLYGKPLKIIVLPEKNDMTARKLGGYITNARKYCFLKPGNRASYLNKPRNVFYKLIED